MEQIAMRRGHPVDVHKELIGLRREQRKLKELLAVPREKLEKQELVIKLRDVRGEIARRRVSVACGV